MSERTPDTSASEVGRRDAGRAGASQPLLEVEGLHVTYRVRTGIFEALHDISFELHAGEVLGVVGESGCGKSTLAASLMHLLPPNGRITRGRIALDGDDLSALRGPQLRAMRGGRVAMIFQDPLTSLNPTFKVSTQMLSAQRAHGIGDDDSRRGRAVQMLSRVGIPDAAERIEDYPHQFSGGMRQRIMIATALLLEPQVLIADEPTSALDVTLQEQILQLLDELCREQGTSLILISHDLGVVSEMCEHLVVLYAGRVVESGALTDVLREPRHPYTRKLLAAVPSHRRRDERLSTIPGRVPSLAALPPGCTYANRCDFVQEPCRPREPPLFETDGRGVRCLIYAPPSATSYDQGRARRIAQQAGSDAGVRVPLVAQDEALLEVDDLQTHFEERPTLAARLTGVTPRPVRAVDGIGLDVHRGEAVGLVGESGSGKTTLGKALLNLAPITAGTVSFDGLPLHQFGRRDWRQMRSRMQMIFQEAAGSLSPRLRVAQLLTEPYRINRIPASEQYTVDELLEMVGLSSEQATKYPHELSGGQARRVGIARALAVRPEFVVADEPTAGLDVSAAASALNLLQDLRRELSLTYLIITHDLNVVGYVADRIAVMYLGKIVEFGTTDEIFDHAGHPYTRALLESIPEPGEHPTEPAAAVAGEIPSPRDPPSGCRFRTRCPFAEQRCADEVPRLYRAGRRHAIACHFWEEVRAGTKARTGPLEEPLDDPHSVVAEG